MAEARTAQSPITELKVSGHLMALDTGLYCIYNAPGTGVADPKSGLPGVRISPAPATGGFKGTVALSGFSSDGWLGGDDGAALIRVGGGPAQILVTIYQTRDGAQDAPKLQVLKLSEAAAAAPAAPAPAPGRTFEVGAHIYGRGDVPGYLGEWVGERGSKAWIEGFAVKPASGVPASDVEYQAVLGRGWMSPWAEAGGFCGSRGMSLPILGLAVRLRGDSAKTHVANVSATFVDGSTAGPVTDGRACEAQSLAALEAFSVTITPKAAPASRGPAKLAAQPAPAPAKPGRKKAAPAPAAAVQPSPKKAAPPMPEPAPVTEAKPSRKKAAPPLPPPEPAPVAAAKPGRKKAVPPVPPPEPEPVRRRGRPSKSPR